MSGRQPAPYLMVSSLNMLGDTDPMWNSMGLLVLGQVEHRGNSRATTNSVTQQEASTEESRVNTRSNSDEGSTENDTKVSV